jgi:hypothetical protein
MADEFQNNDFEGKDIEQALSQWRESAAERAERPDWFWSRQHARAMSRIHEGRSVHLPKLAWASLAATIAIAVSLIMPSRPGKQVQPQPRQEAQLSDHDLMVAIERSMDAGVPSSLEPASLLADEMNQALETPVHTQKAKESKYEN